MRATRHVYLRWCLLGLYVGSLAAWAEAQAPTPAVQTEVPEENLTAAQMPAPEALTQLAHRLFDAVVSGNSADATDLFLPEAPFLRLKDMSGPKEYYAHLVAAFNQSLKHEHARIQGHGALSFGGFEPGHCTWKKVGSEYNKVAYWSCYRSKFYAGEGKRRVVFTLRAAINWGTSWYVTHFSE